MKLNQEMSKNLYDFSDKQIGKEYIETLFEKQNIRIEKILSDGEISPEGFWYDQFEDEIVFLLKGSAVIEYQNGTSIELKEGDYLELPARKKHRVAKTSKNCVWLTVFIK